ncbi:MAG: sortase [Dialister micraerophilus]|uniref:sortase n=1 Tax=Dialister micraerophilus TaxID=309120 RepID=UPI00254A6197|nr:sortase [Dialister micraerophilus]MDK8253116.1 sortase [Dialister micraerophilus]
MENEQMLYITLAAAAIAIICCIAALYALSSVKKAKKEILAKNIQNEENVKNVQEINNTQYPDHVEQADEEGEEIPCTEKDFETQEKIAMPTQEKTQNELEEIDPQIIAVISAAVMCMGAGQVLSIKRTDNAGWKRAARLASMSNGIY